MLDSIYNMTLKVYILKSRFACKLQSLRFAIYTKYLEINTLPGITAPCLLFARGSLSLWSNTKR